MNADRPEEAIPFYKKGLRLDPYGIAPLFYNFGCAYWMLEQYEEAISICKKGLKRHPDDMFIHMVLAVSYIETGNSEEARKSAAEVLRINPKITLSWLAKMLPWKNKTILNRWIVDLRKAGLPEHPPLKLPDKPSIAVLPFDNLSKDPEQEYFADGMTDDLITDLSKISGLFVMCWRVVCAELKTKCGSMLNLSTPQPADICGRSAMTGRWTIYFRCRIR
jgi:tetratricopeptide (TPR) repeat protein